MTETDVVEAFLSQQTADNFPLATDGRRLRMSAAVVAEWSSEGLVITAERQGTMQEQVKDRLVHAVLMRMAEQHPACECARMAVGVEA